MAPISENRKIVCTYSGTRIKSEVSRAAKAISSPVLTSFVLIQTVRHVRSRSVVNPLKSVEKCVAPILPLPQRVWHLLQPLGGIIVGLFRSDAVVKHILPDPKNIAECDTIYNRSPWHAPNHPDPTRDCGDHDNEKDY